MCAVKVSEIAMAAADPAAGPTVREQLAKALAAKVAGNEAVQAQNWKQASFQYKHVSLFIGQHGSKKKETDALTGADSSMGGMGALLGKGKPAESALDPALQKEIDDLIAVTHANLAMAHLSLGRYPQAAQSCEIALLYQPGNLKARYRRAVAKLHLGQLETARRDLEAVLGASPDDAAAQQRMAELVAAEAAAKEKEKRMCAKMFA